MTRKVLVCCAAVLVLSTSVFGQAQVPLEKPAAVSNADQELKRKATLLLAETSQQMRELKNPENQIAARIELANLMWADQETSARRLYREAFDILRKSLDSVPQSEVERPASATSLFRLRTLFVESLGEHDPIMARELLRQIKMDNREDGTSDYDENANNKTAENQSDGEAQRLEMNLNTRMADRNPEEALRAVRESLNKGTPFDTYTYLTITKLAEKNPKIASELAAELVDKLRKADYKKDPNAVEVAMSLIRDEATSLASRDAQKQESGQEEKHAALLHDETLRGFIEFIVDASLKKNYGEYLLMNLRGMQAVLEKVAPAQAVRVKEKWADLEKEYPELRAQRLFRETTESDDLQQMLETARSAEPEMRDTLFRRAASTAWAQGDKARAIEIATKNISSALERSQQLAEFHQQSVSESIASGNFDEARKLIAQTSEAEERLRYLLDLADAHVGKNDSKAALEVLNEVQGLIPAKPRNSSELDFQIRLAETFAVADPDRGFALLSSTIDQINDLMDATARVANFVSQSVSIRDNEFDVESHSGVPGLSTLLSRGVKTMATMDFARTKSLFDKFQRPEIRLVAYLHLSRVILEPERDCSCSCPGPAANSPRSAPKN